MKLAIEEKTDILQKYPECCVFDADDAGLLLAFNYNSPTTTEIQSFKADTPFEIRFVRIDGILFILAKVGSMPWVDAPYAVQLSRSASFPQLGENEGYALTLALIDRTTSTVKGLRLIGLGHGFSNDLRSEILTHADDILIQSDYDRKISEIYRRYSTEQLVRFSTKRYKIK